MVMFFVLVPGLRLAQQATLHSKASGLTSGSDRIFVRSPPHRLVQCPQPFRARGVQDKR